MADGGSAYQTYVVRKGDSLWKIAEEQLGDPNRFADIAELNDGRRMPDGTVFSYVEFLQAGWVLIMPPDMGRQKAELPAGSGVPALEPGAGGAGGIGVAGALARRESTFATTSSDSGKTAAATGGLLAAGVLGALGDKRLRKVMRRRPGERISMRRPSEWELELRRVDNPTGQVLIDAALRTLSAKLTKADRGLPDIIATVLKSHGLELHLARSQPPLAPFYADPQRPGVWICPLGASVGPAGSRNAPAPYPALVSMGFDGADDTVLVDLEATGGVSLLAPEAESVSVLRAMAVELATGMSADQVEVTLVGFGKELPELFAPGRLTHSDDLAGAVEALARWSAGVEAVLDRRGVTLRKARTHPDAELAPITKTRVLLSAKAPDSRLTHRLRHLLSGRSRTSIAVVAVAADREHLLSPWTVNGPVFHTPPSQAGVPGIGLRVQALGAERYESVVRELSAAESDQEKPAPRDGAFNLPPLPKREPSSSKTPLPKRKPSHPRRHGAAAASGQQPQAPARAELIATPDPAQPNRFRVPVDDLFRVDALLPTALPTTTATLPAPGTAREARLALKPANLPQFDPVVGGDDVLPPPRAEDRLVELGEGVDRPRQEPAPKPTARRPGQWQDAYWRRRKAAAAGMRAAGVEAAAGPGGSSTAADDVATVEGFAAGGSAVAAINILGPVELSGTAVVGVPMELTEVAAYVMLHPGCSVQQIAAELWPGRPAAVEIVGAQVVRLREVLGADGYGDTHLRVTPESITLGPAVSCDWLEFIRRTQTGELVGALSLVRGRPFEDAPLRRYGWAETLRHEMAALVIDTAHYVAEACLREQSPRNARKAALRGLSSTPESELLYRDLLAALAALGDLPAARRHADTLLGYAEREGITLQPETAAVLRDVVQAAARS